MKKNKENIKNKEDLKQPDYFVNAKKEDLIVDEHIDDKYTKQLFDKYKNGENKKNKWFTISGGLSIAFGIICIISMIIVGIVFLSTEEKLKTLALAGKLDYDKKKEQVILACILVPIAGFLSIILGWQICKFAKLRKPELPSNAVKIMFCAILQFFVGGVIFSFFTIFAYFMGISSDYGAIYYNRIDKGDTIEKRLQNAKLYYENNLITHEEYEKLKENILNEKEIYF